MPWTIDGTTPLSAILIVSPVLASPEPAVIVDPANATQLSGDASSEINVTNCVSAVNTNEVPPLIVSLPLRFIVTLLLPLSLTNANLTPSLVPIAGRLTVPAPPDVSMTKSVPSSFEMLGATVPLVFVIDEYKFDAAAAAAAVADDDALLADVLALLADVLALLADVDAPDAEDDADDALADALTE